MRYTLLYAIPWIACSSPLPDLVDDVAEANDRPLTWRGPKSAMCISSSRFSDDGSFASKSQENFEFPRWQQTGALEIFVCEDEQDQDQTP